MRMDARGPVGRTRGACRALGPLWRARTRHFDAAHGRRSRSTHAHGRACILFRRARSFEYTAREAQDDA